MGSMSHEPSLAGREEQSWTSQFLVREMWASVAVVVMWLAVLFDAVFGPDIVSNTVAGDHTIIPSAVALAPFAFFGTWVVAKYGYGHRRTND